MKLYVYDTTTMEVLAEIEGETNSACEQQASDEGYGDFDRHGWTYSPAFGFSSGLKVSANIFLAADTVNDIYKDTPKGSKP